MRRLTVLRQCLRGSAVCCCARLSGSMRVCDERIVLTGPEVDHYAPLAAWEGNG